MIGQLVSVWSPLRHGPNAERTRSVSTSLHVSFDGVRSSCGRDVAAVSDREPSIHTIDCTRCFAAWEQRLLARLGAKVVIDGTFQATHEFHLLDGLVVLVRAELRGDWVAFEADGTCWYTVMGDTAPWWACAGRNISKIDKVVKYGHRFHTISRSEKSHRFECECGQRGTWVRSAVRAGEIGHQHHRDAVRSRP